MINIFHTVEIWTHEGRYKLIVDDKEIREINEYEMDTLVRWGVPMKGREF